MWEAKGITSRIKQATILTSKRWFWNSTTRKIASRIWSKQINKPSGRIKPAFEVRIVENWRKKWKNLAAKWWFGRLNYKNELRNLTKITTWNIWVRIYLAYAK